MPGPIRLRWSMCLRGAAGGLLASVAASHSALAQQATVTGVVVEASSVSTVGGATVRLSGSPPFFTNLDGAFRFQGVVPGSHTLRVEAMGYRLQSLELEIRGDTALVITLEPDPIMLDSLVVEGGRVTIKGDILDAVTGQRVLYAQVRVEPGSQTVGAISGHFVMRKVSKGQAVSLVVEAVEYFPIRVALITDADTTLTVELEHDSVAIRLVAQQADKLKKRARSIPYRSRSLDRDDLALFPGWSAFEIVEREGRMIGRLPRPGMMSRDPVCLFIDDVLQMHWSFLWGLSPGQVERIEIFDGGGMVRVYTKRYLVSLMGRDPPSLFYIRAGLMGPVCR